MPATSIDTFFACSLLVIVVVSAMAAMPKVMHPFMDGLANRNESELLQQLAEYVLLSTGSPSDWGSNHESSPADFGLAANGASRPYALDADKVTRLNEKNAYAITYSQLRDALRVNNIALKIQVQPLFDTSIELISSANNGNETTYNFEITTQNSGLAIVTDLSCFVVVGDFVDSLASSTNPDGKGAVSFMVPNSLNDSALMVVFARAKVDASVVSFGVYSFGQNGTFAELNPLNHRLNVSFRYPNEQVLGVYAFSHSFWANLTMLSNATQTSDYSFPDFLDKSITVLVLTGLNGTQGFAEWTAYPQIPLDIGVNFDSSYSKGNVASFTYVVTIDSALYKLQIKCREVG